MAVRPWLESLKKRLKTDRSRRSRCGSIALARGGVHFIEKMEVRTLLASTVLVVGSELKVLSDAGEDVTVVEDPALTEHIEVQIDGSRAAGMPVIRADAIDTLTIETGDTENTIDVSALTSAVFTNLSEIRIVTANGDDTVIGSDDFGESIDTGDGDDTIDGGGGNDSIVAGDGDDAVIGGDGDDTIDAGDGDDNVTGDAGLDEIIGDDGNDTLTGGSEDDSLVAGDGDDVVVGDTGNDTIFGDLGDDTVDGNAGNDLIFAGGGNDAVFGSGGLDSLFGNGGQDTVDGGGEDDSIRGGTSNDSLLGGDGADFINGDLGNDTIDGQLSDDTLNGGGGDDSILGDGTDLSVTTFGDDLILGQSGDDTLIGTGGADTIIGHTGNDLIRSQPETSTAFVAPPVPPPAPPPPPPPPGLGPLNAAMLTGTSTMNLGALATLSNGMGDGNLTVSGIGPAGNYELGQGQLTFDPVGTPASQSFFNFDSDLYFRVGTTGPRTAVRAPSGTTMTGNASEATSTFSFMNLDWTVDQTLTDLFDTNNSVIGSVLNQTYTISNPGTMTVDFELVRYKEDHMYLFVQGFFGNDGGGVLQSSNGLDMYFESADPFDPTQPLIFGGITAEGGTIPAMNRFEINGFFITNPIRTRAANGGALQDVLVGDTDGDGFIDNPPDFDNEVGLRNVFTVAPGGSVTYTTNAAYGTLFPAPPNAPPQAINDTVSTAGEVPATIAVVVNDTDSDGVIDFSTVNVVSNPSNGTVMNLGDGRLVYTADPGFAGTDSFTYNVLDDDGAISNLATVTVTVLAGDVGDFLDGREGDDTIVGAAGNDTAVGGQQDDSILAGPGNDSVLGAAGNDTIFGQLGNDTLFGQGGHDELHGDDGEDTLIWRGEGDGFDTLDGGNGGDTAEVNLNNTGNTLTVGEDMTGRLLITEGTRAVTVEPTSSRVVINAADGQDKITIGEIDSTGLTQLVVNGDEDHDRINASMADIGSVRLELNGGLGADTLTGSNGGDLIDGGENDDEITSGPGDDSVLGGEGADLIDAGTGDDSVNGGDGNDVIDGGDGDDVLEGGNDADSIDGEAGNDTIRGNFGDDNLIGSFGDDSVNGGLGQDNLIGGGGNDRLDGGRNNDIVLGNGGNDTLLGDHGNDFLRGDVGDDEILGGEGNDNIRAGDGDDGIDGGDGDDQIIGDNGEDLITGGDGDDTLIGGGAKDTLLGQEGADLLNGSGASDVGALGEGEDETPVNIELINENFVLTPELMERIDGM